MERLEKERQAELRSYKNLMVADKMTSNKDIAAANKSLQELEEDFMWMVAMKLKQVGLGYEILYWLL